MRREIDYAALDYSRWTFWQRMFQALVRFLLRLLTHTQVEGMENFPPAGPVILAPNHLHWLDIPVLFCFINRRGVVFAAEKWEGKPGIGWILGGLGNAIFVQRGEPDRRALRKALDVLRGGGVLGLAPEGTRSPTGGLQKGHTGVVYLANRSGAPILPVAAYGQEKAFQSWRRLRRARICVRFGRVIELPRGKMRVHELEAHTEQVMLALAALLPPEYRGVYGKRALGEEPKADSADRVDSHGSEAMLGAQESNADPVERMDPHGSDD